jgi:hypothetical protein
MRCLVSTPSCPVPATRSAGPSAVAARVAPTDRFPLSLRRDQVRALPATRHAHTVHCVYGTLWVTQEGDEHDVVLQAGQTFTTRPRRKAVVQALAPSIVLVRTNASGGCGSGLTVLSPRAR